jgi:UDP-N-acetylmuramate-alanine ligase
MRDIEAARGALPELEATLGAEDVVVTIGAGDVFRLADALVAEGDAE